MKIFIESLIKNKSKININTAIDMMKIKSIHISKKKLLAIIDSINVNPEQKDWIVSIYNKTQFERIIILVGLDTMNQISSLSSYKFKYNQKKHEVTLSNTAELKSFKDACYELAKKEPKQAQLALFRLMNYNVQIDWIDPQEAIL